MKYFGTDGIRGAYGSAALNDEIAFRAGVAAARLLKENGKKTLRLLAGRDTRGSGVALQRALAAGFSSEGGKAFDLGVAPTPAIAKALAASDAEMACSITASHNPSADNGLKFFQVGGRKLSDEMEHRLDELVDQSEVATAIDFQSVPLQENELYRSGAYRETVEKALPSKFLGGKRILLDCANGAMFEIAPAVFRAFGAEVTAIGIEPDGANINDGVGSEHSEALQQLYVDGDYDLAFAFDGDGDRLVAIDEQGRKIPGEAILLMLAHSLKSSGSLIGNTLVTTIQSNLGLDTALGKLKIEVERTGVGDKHIARLMLGKGFNVGGEESGHIILSDFSPTGDGLFAALSLAKIACDEGSLASWSDAYCAFPQKSIGLKVASKPPLETCIRIQESLRECEDLYGGSGRTVLRYSGTEPKLRILVEASSDEIVTKAIELLVASAKLDLEVLG